MRTVYCHMFNAIFFECILNPVESPCPSTPGQFVAPADLLYSGAVGHRWRSPILASMAMPN